MKLVHDPIHGYIELDEFAIKIVDTPEFQRLRRITQLGFAFLAYPSARHTRFEHSLGTFHLAKEIRHYNPEIEEEAVYAALLHDIGHYPFSHTLEGLFPRHEENTVWLIKHGEIRDAIEENYSVSKLIKFLKHPVVSGDIDSDRMDYLVRDAYYTGAAYGVVDLERLVRNLIFTKGMLVVGAKGIMAAQNLLLARAMMYPTVYFHHTAKIAEVMLRKAVELEGISTEEIRLMDEVDLVSRLRNSEKPEVRELMKAIDNRKLYKRVLCSNSELSPETVEYIKRALEEEFAHLALIDYPPKPKYEERNAFVLVDGELKRLSEVSPLVKSLVELKNVYWRWCVYARKDVKEDVEGALKKAFVICRSS
ncbi:HD domain-containing protein [Thermococcus gorgonarius]|uniref:Phosphohydrolase n=1 Tax=Thermococcus gorgonarius TaxID=71997 RepID=A0A2Z2MFH5_THEGO|nr:HD domain-containing protein [Thermococcus gorgonarius]ASJ00738.1 phosphohydrolase [Thermococcus gorgonarius]